MSFNLTQSAEVASDPISGAQVTSSYGSLDKNVVTTDGTLPVIYSSVPPTGTTLFPSVAADNSADYIPLTAVRTDYLYTSAGISAGLSSGMDMPITYIYNGTTVTYTAINYLLYVVSGSLQIETPLDLSYILFTQNYTNRECSIDFAYELQTGTVGTLQEVALDMAYSLSVFTQVERTVDFLYSLLTPAVNTTFVDMQYSMGVAEFAIDFKWVQTGSLWMTEMLGYVNALRTSLGRAKMYRLYDGVGPDIATIHAENMGSTHVFAHNSIYLPAGWQSTEERGTHLLHPHAAVSENLQLSMASDNSTITIFEAFETWRLSPVHYAVMTWDWGPSTDPTMLMGLSFYQQTPILDSDGNEVVPYDADFLVQYVAQNFIDMNLPYGGIQMQRTIDLSWSIAGALIETYDLSWEAAAFKHVSLRFYSPYAIKVQVAHTAFWAQHVSASFTTPISYIVSARHEAPYGSMIGIKASHTAEYDLKQYNAVHAAHTLVYSLRMSAEMVTPYGDYGKVQAAHALLYSYSTPVRAAHSIMYNYNVRALIGLSFAYGDQVKIKAPFTSEYTLMVNNPVKKLFTLAYSILGAGAPEFFDLSTLASITIGGVTIQHDGVDVSTSEVEFVWVANVTVSDPGQYVAIAVDMPMTVTLSGTVFSFIVTGKTLQRSSPSSVEMTVTGHSPTIKYTEPRADTISYTLTTPMLASTLAATVLGGPITWSMIDWTIPEYYFAVEGVTPISAVQTIAEAGGGLVETLADGTLVARQKFPVALVNYPSTVVSYTLTDADDNLSYGETINTTDVINKIRIRDGSDNMSDSLEFTADENIPDYGALRAYPLPWRQVVLQHTGGASVVLSPLILESRTEVETVEITEGTATLKYPAVSITGTVWKSTPLTSLSLEARTKNLRSADLTTNYGYGLVEVTYVVECYISNVQFPVGNSAQFILYTK